MEPQPRKKADTEIREINRKECARTLALIVVWLTTGLWHGASWAYIAWGGVNGLFIIFSMWMEPVYEKTKRLLNVKEGSFIWRSFQTLRTFVLVTFIKVLPEVGTLSDGFGLWKRIFTDFSIPNRNLEFFYGDSSLGLINIVIISISAVLLFLSSLLQRKHEIRYYFAKVPTPIRIVLLACLFIGIMIFGMYSISTGGFLYAQF